METISTWPPRAAESRHSPPRAKGSENGKSGRAHSACPPSQASRRAELWRARGLQRENQDLHAAGQAVASGERRALESSAAAWPLRLAVLRAAESSNVGSARGMGCSTHAACPLAAAKVAGHSRCLVALGGGPPACSADPTADPRMANSAMLVAWAPRRAKFF